MSQPLLDIDAIVNELLPELLPEVIVDISKLIGYKNTLKLVQALGGIDFAVPTGDMCSNAEGLLVNAIGENATIILMQRYGGERIYIPRCYAAFNQLRYRDFHRQIMQAVASGELQKTAIQRLAPQYGFTERWAYTVLSYENKRTDTQMRLFD